MCPFCLRVERGGCGSWQGYAERWFWGLVGRLSGKVTEEGETDGYLGVICHYRAEGSMMDFNVPGVF